MAAYFGCMLSMPCASTCSHASMWCLDVICFASTEAIRLGIASANSQHSWLSSAELGSLVMCAHMSSQMPWLPLRPWAGHLRAQFSADMLAHFVCIIQLLRALQNMVLESLAGNIFQVSLRLAAAVHFIQRTYSLQ